MTSLAEVAAALRGIADGLPLAPLDAAADHLERAVMYLSAAVEGSNDPEAHDAIALLTSAYGQTSDTIQTCTRAARLIRAFADQLATGPTDSSSASSSGPPSLPQPATSTAQPTVLPARSLSDRIVAARAELTPGVEGARTDARWLADDGASVPLQSGRDDEWYGKTLEFVTEHPNRRPFGRLATHVEVKMAMRMRFDHATHETIIIDRKVCGRRARELRQPITCDKLLSWFLPAGATLTVVEFDGTSVTYTGAQDE